MPTYTVMDPRSHKTVTLTGDSPPTEQELHTIFAQINAGRTDVEAPGLLSRVASGAGDVLGGLRSSAARTVYGGGDVLRRVVGADRIIDQPDVKAAMTAPPSAAGTAGP